MARGRPVEPEQRAQVIALFDKGHTRNAIAKETGVGAATVTKIIAESGRKFDRSKTAAAVQARSFDMADTRLRLLEKLSATAEELIDSRHKPYLVYNFGGKDNTYEEHTLDGPPVEVLRTMVVTAGIAFDKITKALEKDTSKVSAAHSLLDTLAAGFTAAAAQYETPTDGE